MTNEEEKKLRHAVNAINMEVQRLQGRVLLRSE
jgi:hypothetical protein